MSLVIAILASMHLYLQQLHSILRLCSLSLGSFTCVITRPVNFHSHACLLLKPSKFSPARAELQSYRFIIKITLKFTQNMQRIPKLFQHAHSKFYYSRSFIFIINLRHLNLQNYYFTVNYLRLF